MSNNINNFFICRVVLPLKDFDHTQRPATRFVTQLQQHTQLMINPIEVVSTSEQAKPEQTRIPRRTGGLSSQSYCNLWRNHLRSPQRRPFRSFVVSLSLPCIYVYLLVLYVYLFSSPFPKVRVGFTVQSMGPSSGSTTDLKSRGSSTSIHKVEIEKPSCLTT